MRLKEMREQAGLTQAELARQSGVNLRSLQDYEQGHKALCSAKGETLLRLSLCLDRSIEDILLEGVSDSYQRDYRQELLSQRILAYERGLRNRRDEIVHFPIVIADDKIDMSRVYPTKQREVKNVLDKLRDDSDVTELRLFGSSITMACNKESDIDFAVRLKAPDHEVRNTVSELIQKACEWKADIIWLDRLSKDERIYTEIMKGLVLI